MTTKGRIICAIIIGLLHALPVARFIVNLFFNVDETSLGDSAKVVKYQNSYTKQMYEINKLVALLMIFRDVFMEEVVFRSYIMSKFNRYPITIQAIIFSLFHTIYRPATVSHENFIRIRRYMYIGHFWSGLLYGTMAQLSGSIVLPIIFHAFHNIRVTIFQ